MIDVHQNLKNKIVSQTIEKMANGAPQNEPDLSSLSLWSVWKTTVAILIEHRHTVMVPKRM